MLLLFRCLTNEGNEGEWLAFVPYMECVQALDKVNEELVCAYLQWATAGSAKETQDAGKGGKMEILWLPVSDFEVFRLQSIVSRVHAVRANFMVRWFTAKLPWSSRLLHTNRLFRDSAWNKRRVHEYKKVHLLLLFREEITCSS